MSTRRRNGKSASCEPCRRDKVRCDHVLPVCTRCKNRGMSAQCFYHPAPLTRGRVRRILPLADGVPFDRAPSARNLYPWETSVNSHMPAVSLDTGLLHTCARSEPLLPGYFGPTSFVSSLADDVDLASQEPSPEPEVAQRVLPGYWAQKVAEVLSCLGDFTAIEALVREFYRLSQSAVIPAPYILSSFSSMKSMCREIVLADDIDDIVNSLAVRVIQNTAETFKITEITQGSDFHTLFTGPAVRLEIVGVLCCIAGRAGSMGLTNIKLDGRVSRSQFARQMLAASDAALHVCKLLTPLNDLTVWLVYEILLLSNAVNGLTSSASWNRLGELSTDIFALGLHRASKNSEELPEYILESRRRLFAATFQLDKAIATLLGRPPRIPLRYADSQLPLDLPDTALALDIGSPSYLRSELDENGWHMERPFQRASWIRMRYILSTFRDEILELSMQKVTPATVNHLNDISHRCHKAWEMLPSHLRYTPHCWDQNHPISIWLMLIISYLAYLYNDFLIQRLIFDKNDPRGCPALLSASADLLSTVLTLGTKREQIVDLRADFTWTVLLYGFPSATILIKALQHEKRTGKSIPYEGPRSALIRNLSVFISHLENTLRPENANYGLFCRASQIFSGILDEILEPQAATTDPNLGEGPLIDDQMVNLDELNFFDTMDSGFTFDQWLF